MPISLDPSANYVTQSGIWSSPRLGLLTDRRIAKYQKLGYYSDGFKQQRKEKAARKSKVAKTNALKELLKGII